MYSGSNTDCKSSEPLKTLVMLLFYARPKGDLEGSRSQGMCIGVDFGELAGLVLTCSDAQNVQ